MPYNNYHGKIPVIFLKEETQKWFESIEHISKFNIPKNYVSMSKLKSFGIKVDEFDAIAWAYQAYSHEVCLLYNLDLYKPTEKATEIQKRRYEDYINKK